MIPSRLSTWVHLASLTFCACQIATNEQEMLLQQQQLQQLQQQQLQQTQRAAKAMLNLAHRFITKISPRCRHAASALPPHSSLPMPLAHPLCHPELLEFSETKSRRRPRLASPRLGPRQSISGPSRESRAARCLFASASASNKSFCNLIA